MILCAFWSHFGAPNREKAPPGGYRKKRRFLRLVFIAFSLILDLFGGSPKRSFDPFFGTFPIPGANFSYLGPFFGIFHRFGCFLTICHQNSAGFWCLVVVVVGFLFARNRSGTSRILASRLRQPTPENLECGGLRAANYND